jgi:hypothetical protein
MTSISIVEANKTIINYLIGLSGQLESTEHKIEADLLECKTHIGKIRDTLQLLHSNYQNAPLVEQASCQQSSSNNLQYMDNNLQQQDLPGIGNTDEVDFILNQQYGINQAAYIPPQQQPNILSLQQDAPLSLESLNLIDFPLDENNNYVSALLSASCGPNSTNNGTEQASNDMDLQYQQIANCQFSDPSMNVQQKYISKSPSNTVFQLSQYNPMESLHAMNNHQRQSSIRITLPPLTSILEQRKKRRTQYEQSSTTMAITGTSSDPTEEKRAKTSSNSPIVHHPSQNQDASKPEGSPAVDQSNQSNINVPLCTGHSPKQIANGNTHTKSSSDSSDIGINDEAIFFHYIQERQVSPLHVLLEPESSSPIKPSDALSAFIKVPSKKSVRNMIHQVGRFVEICYGEKEDYTSCFEHLKKMANTICKNYAPEPENENHLVTWSDLPDQVKSELQESLMADAIEKYPQLVKKARHCEDDWFFAFTIQVHWTKRAASLRQKANRAFNAQIKQRNSTLSPSISAYETDDDKGITHTAIKQEVIKAKVRFEMIEVDYYFFLERGTRLKIDNPFIMIKASSILPSYSTIVSPTFYNEHDNDFQ